MQPFSLRCFAPGAPIPPASFFILSRGCHAGRPSHSPNRNCFVLTCCASELDAYYYLVYALWYTRQFAYWLKGSVIPFIRIGDVGRLIRERSACAPHLDKVLPTVQLLTHLETNLQKQLQQARDLRVLLLGRATQPPVPPPPNGQEHAEEPHCPETCPQPVIISQSQIPCYDNNNNKISQKESQRSGHRRDRAAPGNYAFRPRAIR